MSKEMKKESTRFEKWFKSTGYYYGEGFEYQKYTQKTAWIACEKYYESKDKEITSLKVENEMLRKYLSEALSLVVNQIDMK